MDKTVPPGRVKGTLTPPCSKSYAQRALAAALLSEEVSVLRNIEFCDDTRSALQCIETLGARVRRVDPTSLSIEGGLSPKGCVLNVGESGLSTRLFTPVASLCPTPVTIEGRGSLLRRPMQMMFEPLRRLGVRVRDNGGFLPIEVCGPIQGGEAEVDGSVSSQFITGLLLALHYTCWMTSLSFASTFVSTALVCTQPLFVAALSGVLLHEPIKREAVPGAVVAVVGAAAIGLLSMGGESGSLLGDALALIGAAFIAGHWLTSRAARRNLPALGFMTFVYGVTAVFLLLISPFAGGLAVTGESLYGIIVLAVACTLGGHALMTYLLGFVSADVVSFALLAEPIGAAVWALLLFHEKVTPPLMIGGLTVIVGLMLYTYGEMKAGKR